MAGLLQTCCCAAAKLGGWDVTELDADPLRQLSTWLDAARAAGQPMPEAMTIASATSDGVPSARLVALRGLRRGLVFFTDCESDKGAELAANPQAAAVLHWLVPAHRQVRVAGPAERLTRGRGGQPAPSHRGGTEAVIECAACRRVEGWHGGERHRAWVWTPHERRHHVARVPGVPSQGLDLVEPVMYLSWTDDVPIVYRPVAAPRETSRMNALL
jgi:hypothetical protein